MLRMREKLSHGTTIQKKTKQLGKTNQGEMQIPCLRQRQGGRGKPQFYKSKTTQAEACATEQAEWARAGQAAPFRHRVKRMTKNSSGFVSRS